MRLALAGVGLICASFSADAASGQPKAPPPSLKDVKVEATVTFDPATKIYTYRYRVTNPAQNVLPISSMAVDITLPADSIRPRGVTKLPAGPGFTDPDSPREFGPTPASPYRTRADRWIKRGLNFVPVGLSTSNAWEHYGVVPSDKTNLLGNAITAVWSHCGSDGTCRPIQPGDSLDSLVLTSYGLPGIRKVEFQPNNKSIDPLLPPEWRTSEADKEGVVVQKETLVHSLGFLTNTLGPTALPAGYTNAILVTRLQGFVDQSVSLSWITDADFAREIRDRLAKTAAALEKGQAATSADLLRKFIAAVTSASASQRRQEASDLLALNAGFVLEKLQAAKNP
jgi:hypothetical protein